MARPETLNDLREHDKAPHKVFELDLSKVELSTKTAPIYTAVAKLGELFELAGFQTQMNGSQMTVHKVRTIEELTEALKSEQERWDRERKRYHDAIEDPAGVDKRYGRWLVDHHAEREGLPAIVWPVEQEEEDED
ncbi:DUF7432 family protein [Glutamicibacter creatinolyticus]|uniref:DUF7432 family protein n=1 Tax=Glutamicibacter creatinolyticus TaxID=162496 RepID=UPI003217E619